MIARICRTVSMSRKESLEIQLRMWSASARMRMMEMKK